MRLLKEFLADTSGATSIEYAMIGALLSIMCVAGARSIGTKVNAKMTPVVNGLN